MSKKTKTTNTPGWSAPPVTQATTNLQTMVDQGVDYQTPIRNAYARTEQQLVRGYNNPLGAYTTADVRDKSLMAQKKDLNQSMGMDLADARQRESDAKFGRQATVAGLTQPQMYEASSVSKTSDPIGNVIGIGQMGASLGRAFLA